MDDETRRERLSVVDGEGGPLNEAPEPPEGMDEAAADYWREILPLMVEDGGIIERSDLPAFRMWCHAMASSDRFYEKLKDGPILAEGRSGPKKNPAWTQFKQSVETARKLGHALGLTPAGRAGLGISVERDDDDEDDAPVDHLEQVFGRDG